MQKHYTGWPALVVALAALGQRLGNYENKPLAISLLVLGGVLLSVFLFFAVRDILRWSNSKGKAANETHQIRPEQETHGHSSPALKPDRGGTINYGSEQKFDWLDAYASLRA